jgi:hypothetical protein
MHVSSGAKLNFHVVIIFIILSLQEKKAQREDKLKQEEKFMWAFVDGVKEKVFLHYYC